MKLKDIAERVANENNLAWSTLLNSKRHTKLLVNIRGEIIWQAYMLFGFQMVDIAKQLKIKSYHTAWFLGRRYAEKHNLFWKAFRAKSSRKRISP